MRKVLISDVVIFNGFETVTTKMAVLNRYEKDTRLFGYVDFFGKKVLVEWMGSEWWGRTT